MAWKVLAEETPTARKRHYCSHCWRHIEPGEKYHRIRAIGNYGPCVYKSCQHCNTVLNHIWRYDPDALYYYDEGIDLQEYIGDYDGSSLLAQFLSGWRDVAVDDIALTDLGLAAGVEAEAQQ